MNDGIDGKGFTTRSGEERDGLEALADLADELVRLDEVVKQREYALAEAKNEAKIIATEAIPQMIEALGMPIPPEGLKLPTRRGFSILVKEEVHADVSKANMAALIRWLDGNGESGMVKREISVAFNREQSAQAIELRNELAGKYPAVDSKETVHKGTLKAWARRRLEAGEEIPDVVSLEITRKAKVV